MSGPPVIVAATRAEAAALRRGLGYPVLRAGPGRRAAARAAPLLAGVRAVAVAGIGGGVAPWLTTGDVVVATEVRGGRAAVPCPSAGLLAETIRRSGLRVHTGPIQTVSRMIGGKARAGYARDGTLCVDMESADLLNGLAGTPRAAIRIIADPAGDPLLRPATWARVRRATRTLQSLAPALAAWTGAVGDRRVADIPEASVRHALAGERPGGTFPHRLADLLGGADLLVLAGGRTWSAALETLLRRSGGPGEKIVCARDLDLHRLAGAETIAIVAPVGQAGDAHELLAALAGLGRLTITQQTPAGADPGVDSPRKVRAS